MIIYVYMCCNGACRAIQRRTGMRKSMITCPVCGSQMRLIDTEEEQLIFFGHKENETTD